MLQHQSDIWNHWALWSPWLVDIFYHTCPIVSRGWGLCLWIDLGRLKFVINIRNPFMHCVMSQYIFKLGDVIMLLHAVTMVRHTVIKSRLFKWHNSSTQWSELQIWKIGKTHYIKLTRQEPFQFSLYLLCVIKARTHGSVWNDSEMHSTGVTGLHFRFAGCGIQ